MSKFEGTVEDIVFRNEQNGWTVAAVRLDGSGRTSVVGILPFLNTGEHAIFEGELVEHRDYGEQIRVSRYETTRPETGSAIEKYLASGLVRGVGPATAKLIVKKFGARTLDIIESEPERLVEISGIGRKRAQMIAESFAAQNEMRNTLIFLQSYGLSPSLSMKIYRAYGEMTERVLRANPYRLVDEIDGVGFRTADGIARSLGFAPESEFRLRSGVKYILSEAVNGMGHAYLPENLLLHQSCRILSADESRVQTIIDQLVLDGSLIAGNFVSPRAIYLPRLYEAECETAKLLLRQKNALVPALADEARLNREIEEYEQDERVHLCKEQREAVISAATDGVMVITGGPGTGKTTSINCIIRLMRKAGAVELCAPTGRAAKRMSEATGCPARTLHRLLEYGGEGQGFARDADNPLDADVVIVDEMSMVDIFLMRSLLRALRPGARLILVGDADQLPSVGAGNVLRDLIDSRVVPVVRLTEIFRQAQESMIVVNAHRINRGEAPLMRARNTDFFIERRDSAVECAKSVVGLVKERLPKYLNVDRLRGIQVMAPMKKGDLGVFSLNHLLQEALNPPERGKSELKRGDGVFRLGDKVMQIKNDYDIEWTLAGKDGKGVFNGDIGYICSINREDGEMSVEFDDGRRAVYDSGMLDELEIAYCMSVHKSQGSEFEAVVLPLLSGPPMLMTRNLLYTAVTRAKRLVVIVGRESCVSMMVENNRILTRYSALSQRLSGEVRA